MSGAAPPAIADDDETPALGDFFISRDYSVRTFSLAPPSGSAAPPVAVQLDALASASTDFDLTGQIVWANSVLVAHYLAHGAGRARAAAARDVLELGAGCGLCGLTAARAAARVFLTDNEPEVLALLARSAAAHAPAGAAAHVAPLSWGCRADEAALAAAAGRETWELIVGADVIYWSHAVALLFDTVAALLAPRGAFVCGFTNRTNGLRAATEAAAAAAGFAWDCVPPGDFLPDPLPADLGPHVGMMTLYVFRWAEGRGAGAGPAAAAEGGGPAEG